MSRVTGREVYNYRRYRMREFSRVTELFCILTVVVVTQIYTCINTNRTVHTYTKINLL